MESLDENSRCTNAPLIVLSACTLLESRRIAQESGGNSSGVWKKNREFDLNEPPYMEVSVL